MKQTESSGVSGQLVQLNLGPTLGRYESWEREVVEGNKCKILVGVKFQTDKNLLANQPDVVVLYKEQKRAVGLAWHVTFIVLAKYEFQHKNGYVG